ncbi:uncharacterized protein LOC114737443 [Neltuma alba]|uniref:uncharacterized protein LOC114737443 n=1 Tax=Neltuma alba TaxID=207710 RepID=UPI0010A3ED19|nr:uncharacterized protein LOC114737443 [Prosopis alba]
MVHLPNTPTREREIKLSFLSIMDIWSWICELPNLDDWSESPVFELISSGQADQDGSTRSVHLRADRTSGSESEAAVIFTVCLQGFPPLNAEKPLWVSEKCHLSRENPFLPLIVQLVQEIIALSPNAPNSTCPRAQLQKLKPEPIAWVMDSHSPESFSTFFNLVFILRLFWLCACDAPNEAGSLYFQSLLPSALEIVSSNLSPVLRTFLVTVGIDTELCFMRTLGYIVAKLCIFRELGVGLQVLVPPPCRSPGFSYSTEAHGVWALKGYASMMTMMKVASSDGLKPQIPRLDAKESVLKYALAHQQLEALVQLEYSVAFNDGFIQVRARVDNIRLHVAKLGFKNQNDEAEYGEEKHFPSRVRIWVGPEVGATYVGGLSLSRSTGNAEKEVEIQKIVKGHFQNLKLSKGKAVARTSTKTKMKNWRMDQEAEGNAAIFDAVLYDNATGQEVATGRPYGETGDDPVHGLRRRYVGANRPFTKTGSVVLAGDEHGEEVGWKLSKEMEGSVLKWRIGGEFWVSYWPNQAKTSFFETRYVEWCDEVDLPLIPGKMIV